MYIGKALNIITEIKVTESHYDVGKMRLGDTWVKELTEESIKTYHMEYQSRKKLGLSETPMNRKVMKAFYKELYEFVRSADNSCLTVDDCSYTVTFKYGKTHKEVFEGQTNRGEETLIGKIDGFVKLFR